MKFLKIALALALGFGLGWSISRTTELSKLNRRIDAVGMSTGEIIGLERSLKSHMESEDRSATLVALHGIRLLRKNEIEALSSHLNGVVSRYYNFYGPVEKPWKDFSPEAAEDIRKTLIAISKEIEVNSGLRENTETR